MLTRLDHLISEKEIAREGPFATFPVIRTVFEEDLIEIEDVEMVFHNSSIETEPCDIIISSVDARETSLKDWGFSASSHACDYDDTSLIPNRDMFSDGSSILEDIGAIEQEPNTHMSWRQPNFLKFELSAGTYSDKTIGLLMHNYITNIADVLQPAHHPRNPYKSIYVPNALIGSSNLLPGVIVLSSDLSYSNVAIFHALLSVSAFHLRGTKYTDNYLVFEQLGRFHRAQALKNLRRVLKSKSVVMESQAVMAAMMSLVTSDVSLR